VAPVEPDAPAGPLAPAGPTKLSEVEFQLTCRSFFAHFILPLIIRVAPLDFLTHAVTVWVSANEELAVNTDAPTIKQTPIIFEFENFMGTSIAVGKLL
jgi:hypothetical protein